jgi:cytochrome P450
MVDYDPYAYEMHEDPYPTYSQLRNGCPVFHGKRGFWALSRYADVQAALRNWETFTSSTGTFPRAEWGAMQEWFPPDGKFLDMDPPDHERYQALIREPFLPRNVQALEPRIREIAKSLIDNFETDGADFAREFARPLPVTIICEILGIPHELSSLMDRLSLEVHFRSDDANPVSRDSLDAGMKMRRVFEDLITARRAEPHDDLISMLVTTNLDGRQLTDNELLGILIFLFLAGNETTSLLIANLLHRFGEHPEERRRVSEDLSLLPKAIEEALRFDSPVTVLARTATQDVELLGQTIPQGDEVLLLYAAANRDESVFERAADFDLDRPRRRHLAFGDGIHTCLGAPLARLEARVALEEILRRIPTYTLAGPVERYHTTVLRGILTLPVAFSLAPTGVETVRAD